MPGTFRVEVVASAGEASTTIELDAEGLLERRGLLEQAVLASAVPGPPGAAGDLSSRCVRQGQVAVRGVAGIG